MRHHVANESKSCPSPPTSPELDFVTEPPSTMSQGNPPTLSLQSNLGEAASLHPIIENPLPSISFRVNHVLTAGMDRSTVPVGLSNFERKKIRMKANRQLKRANNKISRPHNPSNLRSGTVNKYVRPADSRSVDFDGFNLSHTKFAWTGKVNRDEDVDIESMILDKRIYSLAEMVGPESIFKFTLEKWDGMYVYSS